MRDKMVFGVMVEGTARPGTRSGRCLPASFLSKKYGKIPYYHEGGVDD